jgi:polyisoprenoid-binding protein YceI
MTKKIKSLILGATMLAAPALAHAQAAVNTSPAAVQAGTYTVEPSHTRVLMENSHMGFTTWYSQFTNVAGKIVRTGHDSARVTGELTFHGVTLPETLNVTFNGSGVNVLSHQYTVGFNATGTIKRSDFGVKTYVPLIGDDVSIIISAAFVK